MADGTSKPIEEVQVGDLVLATDPQTGDQGPRAVTHVWPHEDDLTRLSVGSGTIETTEDHPFWNDTDQEWQRVDELDRGDRLKGSHRTVVVDGLILPATRRGLAYDLTVESTHTYYVIAGDSPILVHNCNARFAVDSRGVVTDLNADMSRANKSMTKAGKRKVADKSRANNAGNTVCDDCSVITIPAAQSRRGVTPAAIETRIDHIVPQSLGGAGSPWNGRVTCVLCNGEWSNTPKGRM